MCEYCNEKRKMIRGIATTKLNFTFITDDFGDYVEASFNINYCPMCGEKLKNE